MDRPALPLPVISEPLVKVSDPGLLASPPSSRASAGLLRLLGTSVRVAVLNPAGPRSLAEANVR
jgi:hypothetical protein